jgi:hypothetical protein
MVRSEDDLFEAVWLLVTSGVNTSTSMTSRAPNFGRSASAPSILSAKKMSVIQEGGVSTFASVWRALHDECPVHPVEPELCTHLVFDDDIDNEPVRLLNLPASPPKLFFTTWWRSIARKLVEKDIQDIKDSALIGKTPNQPI